MMFKALELGHEVVALYVSVVIGFREKGLFLDEGNLAWPTRLFARRSDWSLGTHLHGIGNCKVL